MIRVWDPFVRLFHWSLALSVATAWLSPEEWGWAHEPAGYVAGALIVARVFWGFMGDRYAVFSEFVRPPSTIVAYLITIFSGTERRYLGHNPAGGAMIVILLVAIVATAATGWLLTTDLFWGSRPMQILHSLCANAVVVLVGGHVIGVAVASLRHRENLVRAMVTGFKRAPGPADIA
jgi:cytochrome b